jgi:hypothetical protein
MPDPVESLSSTLIIVEAAFSRLLKVVLDILQKSSEGAIVCEMPVTHRLRCAMAIASLATCPLTLLG